MKAFLLLLVVLVLLSVSSVGALKANWVENDVPKGGFSKRAREREAKLRGEKYDDPYAYSSTGAYATAQRDDAQPQLDDAQPQLELPSN
ncbi:hypothetical protein DIPPA_13976 [Diplonema papillatum]|nr:hypothetical protein DIPPA_13976 [Diplonema papillatum]